MATFWASFCEQFTPWLDVDRREVLTFLRCRGVRPPANTLGRIRGPMRICVTLCWLTILPRGAGRLAGADMWSRPSVARNEDGLPEPGRRGRDAATGFGQRLFSARTRRFWKGTHNVRYDGSRGA